MTANTILHLVPRREVSKPETLARCQRAWDSWNCLYQRPDIQPVHVWETSRSALDIGCKRDLPFLVDVLKVGLAKARSPQDIIMFTNDDNILHPMLPEEVHRHAALYAVGSAHRVELDIPPTQIPPLFSPPISFLALGLPHVGRDLFLFNAGWLQANLKLIPDLLLGAWGWDICVALIIRSVRGVRTKTIHELYDVIEGCELPDGLVYHEVHEAVWTAGDWQALPENKHNEQLYKAWCARTKSPDITCESLRKPHSFPISAAIRCPGYMRRCKGSYENWFCNLT